MSQPLDETTRFLIDFNVHAAASALGMDIPDEAAARMYGVGVETLVAYQAAVDAQLAATAAAYHAHPGTAALRAHIPAGGTVLCLGDSITTYRYSYAQLVRHLIGTHAHVVNRGYSGYTTTHALELTYTQWLRLQPDLVILKYGVNDAKQFDGRIARTLVSPSEYQDNLRRILGAFHAHTGAHLVVLTPTPVVEDVVNASPDIVAMRLTWDNGHLAAFAAVALEAAERVGATGVDLSDVLGIPPNPALYCPDGLHPNADGQRRMFEHLLYTFAQLTLTDS